MVGGMVEEFLRVIRSEQAAARISLLDYDSDEHADSIRQAILTILDRSAPKDSMEDTELWLHRGVLHVGRITLNKSLNSQINGPSSTPEAKELTAEFLLVGSIRDGHVVFRPDVSHSPELDDGQVEVQVKFSEPSRSAGANALIVGTVLRTGSDVGSYFVRKEVVAYTTASFSTIIRISVWASAPPIIDPCDLLATLIPMYPAVNASILTAKIQSQEWLLVLPAPSRHR